MIYAYLAVGRQMLFGKDIIGGRTRNGAIPGIPHPFHDIPHKDVLDSDVCLFKSLLTFVYV